MFAGGNGVAAGHIHDDDAPFRGGFLVDIVCAYAGAPDYLEVFGRRDDLGRDLAGAADDDAVIGRDDRGQLVGLLRGLDIDFNAFRLFEDIHPFLA